MRALLQYAKDLLYPSPLAVAGLLLLALISNLPFHASFASGAAIHGLHLGMKYGATTLVLIETRGLESEESLSEAEPEGFSVDTSLGKFAFTLSLPSVPAFPHTQDKPANSSCKLRSVA